MQHLLPLYLIICILPGIAALTVLAILISRFKSRGLIFYFISYSSFTINNLVTFVMFYLGINISEEISYGIFALLSFNIPFSILTHAALPLAVNEVTKPPGKRWIDISVSCVAVIQLVLYWTPLVMYFSWETQTIIFGPLFPFVSVIQVLFISYSVIIIIIRRRIIKNLTIRKYILAIVAIIAVFLPVIVYDQFLFSGVKSIDTVPVAVIFSPFFYFVLSFVTLIFGIRVMISFATLGNQKKSQFQNDNKASQDTIIQNLAEQSGLSVREITIIPLMVSGLGNKQIALELNISPKTVGNHIYNIYKKLNITSRYELLALLK
jgi:DNA-binding CsgD family transcriptional regulator